MCNFTQRLIWQKRIFDYVGEDFNAQGKAAASYASIGAASHMLFHKLCMLFKSAHDITS